MFKKLGGEHTIDVDLLPDDPLVLDVGCRGFQFDYEILELRPKAKIIALDPDPEMVDPKHPRITFIRAAMTHKNSQKVSWQGPGGDGSYIICTDQDDPGYRWGAYQPDIDKVHEVRNTSIADISLSGFDVVKLDCEGSEFGILEAWPGPIATQISVEFHDFIDRNRWNDAYFEKLFAGPLKDYEVKLFGLTPMGPAPSYGHWDTLLVLK